MPKTINLKKLFADDPETLKILEMRENTAVIKDLIEATKKSQANPFDGISQIKGDKGDKGDTPIKGTDYFTVRDIEAFLKASTPIKGKDYFTFAEILEFRRIVTPKKGVDYFDGNDGKSIKGDKGDKGDKGNDGSPDTANGIAAKLNTLSSAVDSKVIRGLPTIEGLISELKNPKSKNRLGLKDIQGINMNDQRWHGGGSGGMNTVVHDTTLTGTGTTASPLSINVLHDDTLSGNGTLADPLTVLSGGTGGIRILTATGAVNDSNTTFTFTAVPLLVVINGQEWAAGQTSGGVVVWTNVGTTVTTAFPVGTGGSIFGIGNTATAGEWIFNETPVGTINGVNTVFTIPSATQVVVYTDGLRTVQSDYTIVGTTLTFNSGRQPFSSLSIDYV